MQPTPVATPLQPPVFLRDVERLLAPLSLTAPVLTLLIARLFLPTSSFSGGTFAPLVSPRSR
jgi:hypothetical protein